MRKGDDHDPNDSFVMLSRSDICALTVFVDAPHVLTPVDMAVLTSSSPESSLDNLGAAEATEETDPALAPRGWWRVNATHTLTNGLEDSLATLRDVLAKDHYEVGGFRTYSRRQCMTLFCPSRACLGLGSDYVLEV